MQDYTLFQTSASTQTIDRIEGTHLAKLLILLVERGFGLAVVRSQY